MQSERSLPNVTALQGVSIIPARANEQMEDSSELAKNAAYSTDKEND